MRRHPWWKRPTSRSRRLSPSPEPLEVAAQALARRDLTEAELDERLARRGVPGKKRAEVLERLRAGRYLDDGRVALDRAGRLAGRDLGDAAIRADLGRRGVPEDLAEQAVSALEPEEVRAVRLAGSLGGGPRVARALARKGFDAETIERVVEAVAEDG